MNTANYFRNSLWQLFEHVVRAVSSIVVVVYVGRYLGPERFGMLSFALSIYIVISTISRFALDTALINMLLVNPKNASRKIVFAGFFLVAAISIVIFLLSSVFVFVFMGEESKLILLVLIGVLFQAGFVFDYYFQSIVRSKFSSLSKTAAMSLGAVIKILLVLNDFDLEVIAFAFAFDQFLIFLFLAITYFTIVKEKIDFDFEFVRSLFFVAFPFMLSAMLVVLFLRVDQLFVVYFLGEYSLGVYAAAIKLYEGWNISVFVVFSSLYPLLITVKKKSEAEFKLLLSKVLRAGVLVHYVLALLVYFYSEEIIKLTFGVEYIEASSLLIWLVFSSLFMFFYYVNQKVFAINNQAYFLIIRSFFSLVLVFSLLLWMVPIYGIFGAVIGVLIALFLSNFVLDAFLLKSRWLFVLKSKAIVGLAA